MSSTVRVVVSFVVVVAACEGGGGWSQSRESAEGGVPTPTPVIDAPKEGEIGSLCARNGDCTSAQCLAIGRCTHACAAASECPVSWACDGVAGAGLLCTCAPTGGGEACNGRDDDCDGFADNGATCGDGLVCVAGSCQCPPERACDGAGSGCTDLANDPDHCGACGNRCGA
ncbi:hypothetical protein L6V77_35720, partial [Myxococcota bacterium]|nr:hypothetical protein [Myxococcota bacterium]